MNTESRIMESLALTIPGAVSGVPTGVQIQVPNQVPVGGLYGTGTNTIHLFLNLFLLGAILLGLFLVVASGFQWITSAGDKQKIQQARDRLVFTVIGLAVVFLAFLFINIVGTFFGVSLIGR